METIIIGGDARFEYLARLLSERGESVGMYGGNACPRVKVVDRAALASAMRSSTRALAGMDCMVIGWGRVGRALTELLVALGMRVTVASRTSTGRNRAVERGAEAADTACIAGALPGRKLIFNTAPAMVLDGTALGQADPDAMLIDLARPPYGIDLRAAWNRGLRAWREPGLPGRYCPQSAAEAIISAMDRIGREEGAI